MKRMVSVTVALLGAFAFFGLASAAQGREPLFPDLHGEDFPEVANHVRFEWLEAAPGSLVGHAFHTRPGDVVFPSVVTAAVSVDRETGATVLQVVRLDDHCLAFAAEIDAPPEEGCLSVTATNIAPGVELLTLEARFFDYRVHFYLVQSSEDAAEWNLAPTGRRGEPQVLRLRTSEAGGSLVADWSLSYRGEGHEVSLPLHVTLPAEALRDAGLSTIHAALASSPELFYDMADFLVWEVLREEQLIDEGFPGPGAEDDDCDVLTMCPAEFQSCTPTPGGWLACSGMGDGWGGGGVACDIGGCGGGRKSREDWYFDSAKPPLFSGVTETPDGYRLHYELTSVLQGGDTIAKVHTTTNFAGYLAHVVLFSLRPENSGEDLGCDDLRYQEMANSVTIPEGAKRKYKGSDGTSSCDNPGAGIYELRYKLDPQDKWDELQSGEANNQGRMRGQLLVR